MLRLQAKRLIQSLFEPSGRAAISSLSHQIAPALISGGIFTSPVLQSRRFDLPCSTRSFASSSSEQPSTSMSTSSPLASAMVQSPLQSLMDRASSVAASASMRQRTWLWYDSDDERKEQANERKGIAERYAKAGYAKRLNVPQSQKKVDRVLKLIRGLRYDEALHQLRMIPHKAGRIVIECLEKAHEDAVSKSLDERRLVVATLFGTKGQNETTGIIYMGKGFSAPKILHRTHITVALREAYTEEERIAQNKNNKRARSQRHREMSFEEEAVEASVVGPIGRGRKAPKGIAFGARIVPPLMHPVPSSLPRFMPLASNCKDAHSSGEEEASPSDTLSLIPTSLKEDDKEAASAPPAPSPAPVPEVKRRPLQASRPSMKKKFDYRHEL